MYGGKITFEVDLNRKNFEPQIEKTKKDLDDLIAEYDAITEKLGDIEEYGERNTNNSGKQAQYQKEQLVGLSSQIQETANKYIDLKKKQDALYQADYKKSIASIKNVNMMDNSAYNKSYSLQRNTLGGSITQIKGDLPYIADGFKDIGKNANEAGNEVIKSGEKGIEAGNLFSKGFGNGIKNLKRLTLGILGIRSVYMLARRAAGAYMSEDTELTEKMNKAWFNLGAFLEPFLSFVADAMLKLTGYLNEFIKALTGTDYLARANAKAIAKQTKEQENLNSAMDKYQQYDFDVIRTQSSTGGGAGGISGVSESGLGALGDVELNEGLVKSIQDIAGAIKDLYNTITYKDVGEAFDEWADAEASAAGAAEDLKNTASTAWKLMINNPDNKTWDEMKKSANDIQDVTQKNIEWYFDKIDEAKKSQKNAKEWVEGGDNLFDIKGYAKQGIGSLIDAANFLAGRGTPSASGAREVIAETSNQIEYYSQSIQEAIYSLIQMAKQGKLTKSGYQTLITLYKKYGNRIDEINSYSDEYKFTISDLIDVFKEYANIYPDATADMLGFGNATEDTKKEVAGLYNDLGKGKIALDEYISEIWKMPKTVDIEFKGDDKDFRDKVTSVGAAIIGLRDLPTDISLKLADKEVKDKIADVGMALGGLEKKPTIIPLKATLDDSDVTWRLQNMRSKLENIPFVGATMSKLFSGIFGFASGGYVSQPTLAWVGEGKSKGEYMIPDGEDYISRLASEIGQYGGSGTTNIYLDGRLIQRQVSKTANQVSFTKNGR